MRKVIQHYGGYDGAEMAAVYLRVVSMVKPAGVSSGVSSATYSRTW